MARRPSRAPAAPARAAAGQLQLPRRRVGYHLGYSYCCCALLLVLLAARTHPAAAFRFNSPQQQRQQQRRPARTTTRMQAAADGGEAEPLLSPLLGAVATSKTIEIHALTKAMEARGEEVVSLCVGEPDFPPPPGAFALALGRVGFGLGLV